LRSIGSPFFGAHVSLDTRTYTQSIEDSLIGFERNTLLGGYAFLEQPQTNGVAEVREAVDTFVDLYSDRWLPEKNGFISPSATREAWYAR